MAHHKELSGSNNHVIHTWEASDATARTAIVVASVDVGKICWQKDDDSLWILKNHNPVTWKSVRNESPVYRFNNKGSISGAASINVQDGALQRITCTGPVAVTVSGWHASGTFSELMLEVDGAANLTAITGVKWIKADGTLTTDITQNGVTRQSSGNIDFALLWSRDGGSTVYGKFVR
jgi:hypothetical protein